MASTRVFVTKHKRRRQSITDYRKRLKMLLSHKTRAVVRKTNKYIVIQFVDFSSKGDVIKSQTNSRELVKKGWKYSCNNLPAAYLAGILAGKKAKTKGIKEAILDIGLKSATRGNVIFSALKGISDSGIKINYDKEIMPDEKRIRGEHIKTYRKIDITQDFEKLKGELAK